MNWSQNNPQFLPIAKAEFATVADGWLVAFARARNYAVVTHETFDANIRRRIKIPNVCQAFHVPFFDTFQMLRNLSIRLS